jgi:hypothetical protein
LISWSWRRENHLTPRHLEAVAIQPEAGYVIDGAIDDGQCVEFDRLWATVVRSDLPGASYGRADQEFVRAGVGFFRQHANMGAMMLECTGFPSFARALQPEIDIPVYSWGTLLDFAYAAAVQRDYYGHV